MSSITCGTTSVPTQQPRKNSGTAAATKLTVYRISFRVSPGMMKAQICHSQIGAERKMPIEKAIRMRRSKADVTFVKFSAEKSSPRCAVMYRMGPVIQSMTGSVMMKATTMPRTRPAAASMSRLRSSMRCAPIDMRLSRRGPSGTSSRGGPAVTTC